MEVWFPYFLSQIRQIRNNAEDCPTDLLVEVDGPVVSAEPDLAAPGEAPDGHDDLSLRLGLSPNTDVVLVAGYLVLQEVHAGDVRLPVRVDDDDVVVFPPLSVGTETVSKAAVLVLAEETVDARDEVVGPVQEELQYVRFQWLGTVAGYETFPDIRFNHL